MLKTPPPRGWDAFFAWLVENYWGSVPEDYRSLERPEALRRDGEPQVPSEIWRAALMIFSDPEVWLHNPIPNQRNRSPLQLIARGQGERLRDILMEVAPFFLAPLEEVRQFGEVAGLASDEEQASAPAAPGDEAE